MTAGIDYAWGRPSPAQIRAAGASFACRYVTTADPRKRITRAEADALKAAGIAIVAVFEDAAQAMLRSRAGGTADAQAADQQVTAAGLAGIPIYFACDFDATPGQQAQINAYLDGAASVVGLHRTGIYGGFWPLSRARAAGKAAWFWGTAAWSGANWRGAWKPHIMQGGQVTIGGVSCDWDTANFPAFGQYPAPAEPMLQLGASGPAVARLQARLAAWGARLTADGVFGAATLTALLAFQAARRLAADGVCGPLTWAQLDKTPPAPPAPAGPFRHVADGTMSLAEIARRRNTTVQHLVQVTAGAVTAGDLAAIAQALAAADVPLPKGFVWYSTNP